MKSKGLVWAEQCVHEAWLLEVEAYPQTPNIKLQSNKKILSYWLSVNTSQKRIILFSQVCQSMLHLNELFLLFLTMSISSPQKLILYSQMKVLAIYITSFFSFFVKPSKIYHRDLQRYRRCYSRLVAILQRCRAEGNMQISVSDWLHMLPRRQLAWVVLAWQHCNL